MDKKTKIFFLVIALLVIGSVALTFCRIMVKKDYIIEGQADCDPTVDKCFVWKCDTASNVEGEKCTGDVEKDIWYYQIAKRKASQIPLCNPDKDENCNPWTCGESEKDCSTTFCNDQNKVEQEAECSNPEQYNIDNPPTEKNDVCSEGDTECTAPGDAADAVNYESGNSADTAE